jgi:hypothetical protein
VHISVIRVSEKAFTISSMPIPFMSPQEMPIAGLFVLISKK